MSFLLTRLFRDFLHQVVECLAQLPNPKNKDFYLKAIKFYLILDPCQTLAQNRMFVANLFQLINDVYVAVIFLICQRPFWSIVVGRLGDKIGRERGHVSEQRYDWQGLKVRIRQKKTTEYLPWRSCQFAGCSSASFGPILQRLSGLRQSKTMQTRLLWRTNAFHRVLRRNVAQKSGHKCSLCRQEVLHMHRPKSKKSIQFKAFVIPWPALLSNCLWYDCVLQRTCWAPEAYEDRVRFAMIGLRDDKWT